MKWASEHRQAIKRLTSWNSHSLAPWGAIDLGPFSDASQCQTDDLGHWKCFKSPFQALLKVVTWQGNFGPFLAWLCPFNGFHCFCFHCIVKILAYFFWTPTRKSQSLFRMLTKRFLKFSWIMALIPWYQIMTTRSQLFITVGKVETRRYYQNVLSNSKYFFYFRGCKRDH